jgi:hypothetical protein
MSGSILKLIACIAMLFDHIAAFMPSVFTDFSDPLITIGDKAITFRMLFHYIGRTAFPIFAFLITEGFHHTRDRRRYAISLFLFALISEIPWNLVHSNGIFHPKQNVFFTLLLGYLGIYAIEFFKNDKRKAAIATVALFLTSIIFRADYGCFGFGFILLLYLLRERKILMAVIGSCVLPSRWIGGTAFIPILLYNGKRGFVKGKWIKYAFYIFYPLHLFLIYLFR